ncbi:MAG: hypothetical protein HXX08_11555 [Chloroflexi bacterium]|uniref:Uncharacterized protein n=1 Tax=Candidatus Chlorohelix allophototropha TaxID=3003348 RepID=A0A8T7M3E8_9CHLR|nr:hypothetical protein [Chloroflexota bacterium]WJW65875.1 hypothetical protein OZ401_001654 [Chloroflexota bacterium L227-S17]
MTTETSVKVPMMYEIILASHMTDLYLKSDMTAEPADLIDPAIAKSKVISVLPDEVKAELKRIFLEEWLVDGSFHNYVADTLNGDVM